MNFHFQFIRKLFTCIALFLFPASIAKYVLCVLGHRIEKGASIGFSFIWCNQVLLCQNVRIGHGNLLILRRLLMRADAAIGRSNILKGPFSVWLKEGAALGNRNRVLRAINGVTIGSAMLKLGVISKFTSDHIIDCTCSVVLGNYSTFAGARSQVWTHGYIHHVSGAGRYRIDAPVRIGNNVYIGSACLISMGVTIADGIVVGGGASIGKSLLEPGLYVSAGIRQLPRPVNPDTRSDLVRLNDPALVETVYRRR